jgi:uncharacterized MAPEG superfamily protein
MKLSNKQHGVTKGMALGILISIAVLYVGITLKPCYDSDTLSLTTRLTVASHGLLLCALCLMLMIGRLAQHRFFSPEDIDASLSSTSSAQARIKQALLQNTLEQTVLAALAYVCWAMMMPSRWLSVIPLASFAFLIGRLLFFACYKKGAAARSLGFTLTFYPTLFMLLGCVFWQISHLIKA